MEALMRFEAIETTARPATRDLICSGCGCTDSAACRMQDGSGCFWVSHNPPLCSACAAVAGDMLDAGELEPGVYINEAGGDGDGRSGMFGAERCPASRVPALHAPIWIDATSGYCARCRQGFVT